ncbi:MAG: biotin carboxylase N-terminal domain-containing protein, partial [Alphaproteobacteria bacterium]|nr:biotin carboxylase N-terminal domain-containing protein [Alphaproteobacteria bacterium]
MSASRLLVANRGEVAIRILRTAAEMALPTVAVYAEDDANSLHRHRADQALALPGRGAAAYLDGAAIIELARQAGCDAIHPGYGFLSENADFARACAAAGIGFIGPAPETLDLFGDKAAARALAERAGVPVLPGTGGPTDLAGARAFLAEQGRGGAMMIKAIAGGGGRGMRAVAEAAAIEDAFAQCRAEAEAAFGNGDLYMERLVRPARHVEVQVLGDAAGRVGHLGERECSIQRRHQKLVEIAPAANLDPTLRERLTRAAVTLAEAAQYHNIGTVEFLIEAGTGGDGKFYFIETNPRLQVEHTVTEEIMGVDLVRLQLELAAGRGLDELGLTGASRPSPRGRAMQLRVNMETIGADGGTRPSGGTLSAFEAPSGPGVRVDGFGYAGYRSSPSYDSLLAKLIVHGNDEALPALADKAYRALCEFRIDGISTNLSLLQNLLRHDEFRAGNLHTGFLDEHLAELTAEDGPAHPRLYVEPEAESRLVGAKVDAADPLAVLHHGKAAVDDGPADPSEDFAHQGPDGTVPILAPMQGTIVSLALAVGDTVHPGGQVLIMEAMKMQHVIAAETSGYLRQFAVAEGDTVFEGYPLAYVEEADVEADQAEVEGNIDLDEIRPDLAEVQQRQAATLDPARPQAVARRRKTHQRTARENVDDLCDPGSFVEYGSLVLAARRAKHS